MTLRTMEFRQSKIRCECMSSIKIIVAGDGKKHMKGDFSSEPKPETEGDDSNYRYFSIKLQDVVVISPHISCLH